MKSVLVVGAGFAGAVYARCLAEAGYNVTVIDKRKHVAGNAFDRVGEDGVRYHVYGPHLFHTNNNAVVDWLSRFTAWMPYEHRVQAILGDGRLVPLPVNRSTIETVFGRRFASSEAVRAFLAQIAEPITQPVTAAEYLYSQIGRELTDLFFRPYTRKMWGHDLDEMHRNIVKRLPISYDNEDRYFPQDAFQALPVDGYSEMFERIFDHSGISVHLSTKFTRDMLREFDFCFNAMPIDEFFDFGFGELPYRSIKFYHGHQAAEELGHASVLNFTDRGPLTRITLWHRLPGHAIRQDARFVTSEEPCDYRENNMERYYPVQTADDRYAKIYERYAEIAKEAGNIEFIGRCGTYRYLNMDQVVNQSLMRVRNWITARA